MPLIKASMTHRIAMPAVALRTGPNFIMLQRHDKAASGMNAFEEKYSYSTFFEASSLF
jgi:hypothetical protein